MLKQILRAALCALMLAVVPGGAFTPSPLCAGLLSAPGASPPRAGPRLRARAGAMRHRPIPWTPSRARRGTNRHCR